MRQYKVSRGTVTRALRDLEVTGVLNRRRGSGTFVRGNDDKAAGKSQDGRLHMAIFMPWTTTERAAGPFHVELHHGISRVCSDHHATLTLQCLSPVGVDQREQLVNAAKALVARGPKVVLYCGLELDHEDMHLNLEVLDLLTSAGIEIIVIDRDVVPYPERSKFTWVSFDNRRGSAMLVRHLCDEGYQRVAFVGIRRDSTAVFDRLSGYHDGLRLCGLQSDPDLVIQAGDEVDEALVDRVLAVKPDAIICKDTSYAARIGLSLGRRGIEIGRDIGLAGFDDDPIASMLPVPLTTVRQPIGPFSAAAYQMAEMIAGVKGSISPMPTGSRIVIPTELVARASTKRQR